MKELKKRLGFFLILIGFFIIIIQPFTPITGAVIDISTSFSKFVFFIGLIVSLIGISLIIISEVK